MQEQCVKAANERAAKATEESAVRNTLLPLKRAAQEAVLGAVIGCTVDWETGCLPGAAVGAAAGVFTGFVTGVILEGYYYVVDIIEIARQRNRDLASCTQ